jgi:type IX secretion system PorP/SprF family membrane protein
MTNCYTKIWIFLICIFFMMPTDKAVAQDIHYSQFYTAPLLLNPALTGHIEGKYRINLNYKRQWTGVTKGGVYNTPALSFDINLRKRSNSKHSFGAGIVLMNDLSSTDNKLSNLLVLASGAAHLNLDGNEKHFITIGLGAGFSSRRLKSQNLLFASQYNGEILDPTISSGEDLSNATLSNVDTRVGIVYGFYPSANTILKAGVSVNHLVKMDEAITISGFKREPNFVGHAELEHYFNDKIGIQPYFLFMAQAKGTEITAGANVNFMMGENKKFFVGGGYRVYDGAMAVIGFEISRIKLGLSYDIATTDLGSVTNGKGDFELSLQYIGITKKNEEPVLPALRYF